MNFSSLSSLSSETAQEQPSFVRKVVLGYLQKKLDKGMSSSQVGEKLHALESVCSFFRLFELRSPHSASDLLSLSLPIEGYVSTTGEYRPISSGKVFAATRFPIADQTASFSHDRSSAPGRPSDFPKTVRRLFVSFLTFSVG